MPTPRLPHPDRQFERLATRRPEIEHRYGERVHLLSDPFLLSLLARLCSPETTQPLVNQLLQKIYAGLFHAVAASEFPTVQAAVPTRMQATHPEGVYQGPLIDPKTRVVAVNLARAGTLPSALCYDELNYLLDPANVRQDHISIARQTDKRAQVTGSEISGHKIGGPIEGAIVLFPDPMAATGSTIDEALAHYKGLGKPLKFVCMHCIVTPEYLKRVLKAHPDVVIYAARLDRGLSPPEVLDTVPGTRWEQEKGLNDHQYIVPGGGGFGEILNNAFV